MAHYYATLNMSSSGTNKQQTSLFSFFGGGDGTKSSGGGGTSSSGKKSKSDTSGGRASKQHSAHASSKKAKTNSSNNKGGKKNATSTTAPNKQKKSASSGPSKKKRRISDDKPAPDTATATTTTPRKPSSVMINNAPNFSSFSYAKGGEAAVAADDTPMSAATTRTAASTPSPSLKSASPPLDTTDADIDIDDNADAPIEVAERKDAKDVRDEQEVGSPTAGIDANEGVAEEAQTSLANVENATTNASDSDSEVDDSSDSDSESTSARGEHQLSDYELLRLRNIERNNRRLVELGLAGDWSSAMPSNATQQQAKKKRARKKVKGDTTKARTPAMPTRRSTRARRTVLEATAEGEGSFGASNLSAEGIDVAKPKYQEMAEFEEEAVEEVFTVSPMLEYAMNADGAAGDAADSSIHEEWSTNTQPNDIQCLKPIGKRLAPPNGLGAIYSLQFYPQEWCPEQRSGNHSWMVGAGKAGIISLWDCNWSAGSSTSAAEDEMIDPVLSWKAHSGRWVADVRFLPSASSKSPPSRLLSAANDGSVCLWDLSTVSSLNGSPKMLCRTGKELHRSGIFAMDVDVGQTQTHIATGSKDKTVAVTALDAIARGNGFAEPSWVSDYHAAKVGAVALCGKGTSLVARASDDGSIAVHDFRADGKKRVVAELIDAHYRPHSVSWDPLSANHLMTAGLDDQIKVFDIRSLDKPLFTYQGHVPTLSKYKRIHHPVFYNPCQRTASSELFVLSGGESSAALSMFRNEDAKESVVSVYSRGRLPADCGDAGCLAIQGQRVASTVDGGEVLLLAACTEA